MIKWRDIFAAVFAIVGGTVFFLALIFAIEAAVFYYLVNWTLRVFNVVFQFTFLQSFAVVVAGTLVPKIFFGYGKKKEGK